MSSPYSILQNPSCYLHGPGIAKIKDSPMPEITDPNDVIIRIGYVGVCGSDVHFWTHGGIQTPITKPLIPGHEASGTIHSTGSKVTTLQPNDTVAIEPSLPCRRCPRCKSGSYHFCRDMKFASTPDRNGMLVRWFKTSEDFCYKLPTVMNKVTGEIGRQISLKEGVLIEPLAVAVHVAKLGNVKLGDTVVIFGAGTVGLLCAAVAKAMGASKIISVDINAERLAFAKGYASTAIYQSSMSPSKSASETASKIILQSNLGEGADVVLEATGVENCIDIGIHVLKSGGKFVQAGLGKMKVEFPIVALSEKELCFRGSFRYAEGDFEMAIGLVGGGDVSVRELITNEVEFERMTEAWELTRRGVGIKSLIEGPRD